MRLAAFEGVWTMTRTIEDVLAGTPGRLDGTARFSRDDGGLVYAEAGALRLGDGAAVSAARRYLWRDGGAGAIDVRFEDGRPFHRFQADDPRPSAAHDCPPDRYRVRYDFRAWPLWTAEWRVRGPRKHYALRTVYRPPRGEGDAA